MMNLITKLIKREPRGGQFVSFEDRESLRNGIAWKKCEHTWESMYMAEYSDKQRRRDQKRRSEDDPTESCTEEQTSASALFGKNASSDPPALFETVPKSPPKNGLAVTYRKESPNRRRRGDEDETTSRGGELSGGHGIVNVIRQHDHAKPAPLMRSRELDELARLQAETMAKASRVFHSDPTILLDTLAEAPAKRLGENVFKGSTFKEMNSAMTERASHYANLTDARYTAMGMATAKDSKGVIYQCQIFRG